MTPLRATLDAIEDQRWDEAMTTLVGAWRAHRAPALEPAISALSQHLAAAFEDISTAHKSWQEVWQERARKERCAELGSLLPLVTQRPIGGIPRRVRLVLAFGPDPRTGELLMEMIESPPTTASSNFSMWSAMFAALPEHVDERVRARLEARAADKGGASGFWPKLEAWISKVLPELQPVAELPEDWVEDLGTLEAAVGALASAEPPELLEQLDDPLEWESVASSTPAREALERDELQTALDLLVAFWGGKRNPRVAEAIERLGHLVDPQLDPIPIAGKTKKAFHKAWMSAGDRPAPSGVGALLDGLREGKLEEVESRIEAMMGWRPDPRVANAMVVLTRDYMLGARDRLWMAVYDVLTHHADPRVMDYMREQHRTHQGPAVLDRARSEGRNIRRVFEAFSEVAARPTQLSPLELADIDAIHAQLQARHEALDAGSRQDAELERGLVDAILANWDADGPRLVYSDWLQGRDDPRGGFIALDLALAQGRKVKGKRNKYLKAHSAAIIGPLARLADYGHEFERGLLSTVRISTGRGALECSEDELEDIYSDLRWATVTKLKCSTRDEVAGLLAKAPLDSLLELSRPDTEGVFGLTLRSDELPLRLLEFSIPEATQSDTWDRFRGLHEVLPRLEEIGVSCWSNSGARGTPPEGFFALPLVRRLKRLRSGSRNIGGVARVDEWLERIVETGCTLPLLSVVASELSGEFHQPEPGVFDIDLRLERLHRPTNRRVPAVLAALEGLPRAAVRSLRLTLGDTHDDVVEQIHVAATGLPIEMGS